MGGRSPFGDSPARRILRAALLLALVCIAFGLGLGAGARRWPPYELIRTAKNRLISRLPPAPYRGEEELLGFAFTAPLLASEMVHPPIRSLEELHEANRSLFLDTRLFFDAYEDLIVVSGDSMRLDAGATELLRVTYDLGGARYQAYAYADRAEEGARAAALIIPGTGHNQSSAIYRRVEGNYHFGVLGALPPGFDAYVFIKPNEDCLALHNGAGKLRPEFIVNWHINHGGSYSAGYVAGTLAVAKYLRREYESTAVIGLSQGGIAALLNALQSGPDAAVVASGFSVLRNRVLCADHEQLVIPGIWSDLPPGEMRRRIAESRTRFLFTYGAAERGTYRIEAEEHRTAGFLGGLENVRVRTHEGGHVFPREIIREFLAGGSSGEAD